MLITTLPEYQQLQIRLWAALDNKDRKYIDNFAQELFDKILNQEYEYLQDYEDMRRDLNNQQYDLGEAIDDLEDANKLTDELYNDIKQLKEQIRRLENIL